VERRYRVSPAKVCLIPSGTDLELIRPLDPRACRQTLGLALEGAVIAFLGVLYPHQGVRTLLAAVPEILRERPGTHVLIVGDGPARRPLEADAQALGLGASVAFVGRVPYDRVPLYLGAADCCVAPFTAQRGETSPLKLFDYLAAGRPVVASAIPAIADLVKASDAIVTVPPEDPRLLAEEVVALLNDPRRRQLLGEAGRRYVEAHHGWDLLAKQLISHCD
jgi:glycosyltransferase involved in cell wall biosynthesis